MAGQTVPATRVVGAAAAAGRQSADHLAQSGESVARLEVRWGHLGLARGLARAGRVGSLGPGAAEMLEAGGNGLATALAALEEALGGTAAALVPVPVAAAVDTSSNFAADRCGPAGGAERCC